MKISIIFVLFFCSGVAFSTYFTQTRQCLKPEDCGTNECCVLGMQRYSYPICDVCLMLNEPEDKNLSYPNKEVQAYKLHRLYCPCASSLHCEEASCSVVANIKNKS